MSKQVLDISQMQHLKELGADTSKAIMCYRRRTRDFRGEEKVGRWSLVINQPIIVFNFETYEEVPTFTLQDILDLLPKSTKYGQLQIRFCEYPHGNYGNEVEYDSMAHNGITFFCENVIDSAYEMLCLCIKEGFVKTSKED